MILSEIFMIKISYIFTMICKSALDNNNNSEKFKYGYYFFKPSILLSMMLNDILSFSIKYNLKHE